MELRSHKGSVEVRQGLDGGAVISGYAAVFNRESSDLGFIEQIDPGAFNRTLKRADVRALGNHEPNWLLGRNKSGTLRLSTDSIGLKYEVDVNTNDPDGVRALEKVRRGDLDGSSFSFNTIQDQWDWSTSPPQRRLLEVALIDVGPVTFPAYPDATATARALEPIAAKIGHPVERLVDAMRTGEIRSLIDGGTANMDDDAKPDTIAATEDRSAKIMTWPELEERVGKSISAATAARIEGAINGLRELLDGSTVDGDADDDTLVGQALEMDSVPMAKEKDDNTPSPLLIGAGRAILAQWQQRVLEDAA